MCLDGFCMSFAVGIAIMCGGQICDPLLKSDGEITVQYAGALDEIEGRIRFVC